MHAIFRTLKISGSSTMISQRIGKFIGILRHPKNAGDQIVAIINIGITSYGFRGNIDAFAFDLNSSFGDVAAISELECSNTIACPLIELTNSKRNKMLSCCMFMC